MTEPLKVGDRVRYAYSPSGWENYEQRIGIVTEVEHNKDNKRHVKIDVIYPESRKDSEDSGSSECFIKIPTFIHCQCGVAFLPVGDYVCSGCRSVLAL